MSQAEDDYLTWLARDIGYPTWDAGMRYAVWRSGWRWVGVLTGAALLVLPAAYLMWLGAA